MSSAEPPQPSQSPQPSEARWLLRNVDGVPHVVLGPLVLLGHKQMADAIGVPRQALLVFAAAFTLYGVVVLVGLRPASVPGWLMVTAVLGNAAFLMAVMLSNAVHDLTVAGRWAHVLVLLSGAAVTTVLVRSVGARSMAGPGDVHTSSA